MSLSPSQIETLGDKYLIGIWQQLESDVIADVARRVKKTGRYTETAEIMARNMIEQGFSSREIQSQVLRTLRADNDYKMWVAENTKAYKAYGTEEIEATVRQARLAGNKLVADAGNMAYNNDLSMWDKAGVSLKKPNTMTQLINAFSLQTNQAMKNLSKTLAFRNTANGYTAITHLFQKELDIAVLKVATGTFS